MASIVSDPNGRKRILFVHPGDGSRKAIRLGKATMKQAEAFKLKMESLIGGTVTGSIDDETSRWIASLPDTIHARVAAVGLVREREGGRAVLGAFIDAFIAGRADMKPHTLLNMQQVRQWLVKHFGENRDMRTITPGDAEDWRATMLKGGLGENTIRRHVGRARQLFKAAIRRGLLRGANPLDGMAATVRADKSRMYFVTREDTAKVIDACPDSQWKLMVALSRYGGLRCPSETLSLRWSDVDWERGRIRVPSPKTEHHEGKDCRMIPMFPELRPYLLDVFERQSRERNTSFPATANDTAICGRFYANHHQGGIEGVEQAVAQPALDTADRACREIPNSRCLRVAGEQPGRCAGALLASDRCPLCRCVKRRGAKSGAVHGGIGK